MSKVKSISVVTARVVLGLIYFIFGLNFFLQFLPTPPSSGGVADAFLGGLFQSGYFFPLVKSLEVVLGAFLIIRLFVPLSLVILMPISLNILLFHVFLTPGDFAMAAVIMVIHLYLAWAYRESYKPLFNQKATASL